MDVSDMTMDMCDVTMGTSQLIPSSLPSLYPRGLSVGRSSHMWDGDQCSAQPLIGQH